MSLDTEIARRSIFLRTMPDAIVERLLAECATETKRAGEVVFRQEDPAVSVLIVTSGLLKLSRVNSQGAETVVHISNPGESIATALAFDEASYPVTCSALETSRYLVIDNHKIRDAVLGEPASFEAILRSVYAHLHSLVEHVEMLKANSTVRRVAQFLVNQADGKSGAYTFDLPYEKSVIAGVLGMAPETLSRAFAQLRAKGVHVVASRVSIKNVDSIRLFLEGN